MPHEYPLPGRGPLVLLLMLASGVSAPAFERQVLPGHVPPILTRLTSVERLASTNHLSLTIGLPLRRRPELTNLLHQLYDPTSARFRRYLTTAQFTDQFGPTTADYQAAIAFAETSGLRVAGVHPNRLLLDVQGTVADVEKTFHVTLRRYPHPQEPRTFYAPEREPAVDLAVPLLHIGGLDNYATPHPMNLRAGKAIRGTARFGSGPNGEYTGTDFRTIYVPGTALTGAGQTVGLFELNGYYASDINAYETQSGIPAVALQNVLIDGFSGSAGSRRPGGLNEEVALDIEMAVSMAPGLASVIVYEGSPSSTTATIDDLLNRMASDNLASQLSCSWGFDIDETSQQIFLEYAAQGQSFFLASGDTGAFSGAVIQPADNPYLTVVGGTSLTTDSAQRWVAEATWSDSSGGISTVYPIPDWQLGIDMSANRGSISMRNTPDVAMVADNVLAVADRGQAVLLSGTSIAAPLWAGYTALMNERAATQGKPAVGFLNPFLYQIAKGSHYSGTFHDITVGSNANTNSPNLFPAVPGFDLCTGWGSPKGTNLIEALLASSLAGLVVTPPLGFLAAGPVGGPFTVSTATYTLANAGTTPLNWAAVNTAAWLDVLPSQDTLAPGGTELVTVSLNTNASNGLLDMQTGAVSFTDLGSGIHQDRQFWLSVGNSGFETGDFTDWTFNGQPDANFVDSIDANQWYGSTALAGVPDSEFVHSGIYGAFLGQTNSLGFLSQTLPTISGQDYVLSFWLANPAAGTPNQFQVTWNGTSLLDESDWDQFGWTNFQYLVTGGAPNSVLQFGFRNDLNAFALDDVSIRPVLAPAFTSIQADSGMLRLTWSTVPGITYQLQYADELNATTWSALGSPVSATSSNLTASDPIHLGPGRFYRVLQAP